jgi:hypothetical protein
LNLLRRECHLAQRRSDIRREQSDELWQVQMAA